MDLFEKRKNKNKKKRRRRRRKMETPANLEVGLEIFGQGSSGQPAKGTERLMEVFSPLLLLFDVRPTGNLFKDFGVLADKITDEHYFLTRIFTKIFDQYDLNSDGVVDQTELKSLLRDVGAAIGDKKLENLTDLRLDLILEKIDSNRNGLVERHELLEYLVQWVENEDDYSPVPAIPPYRGDDSYYPMSSSYTGSISDLSDIIEKKKRRSSSDKKKKKKSRKNSRVLDEFDDEFTEEDVIDDSNPPSLESDVEKEIVFSKPENVEPENPIKIEHLKIDNNNKRNRTNRNHRNRVDDSDSYSDGHITPGSARVQYDIYEEVETDV